MHPWPPSPGRRLPATHDRPPTQGAPRTHAAALPLARRFPRPVHHRIPNFVDAEEAAARLATLPEFLAARVVKVNPDTPQKAVRKQVRGHEPSS